MKKQSNPALLVKRLTIAALAGTILAGGGFYFVSQAYSEATLREAYLPELEEMLHNDPNNGSLLALTAGRHAEAGDFETAAKYLERAVAAGESSSDIWITWSASLAVSGNREQSGRVLALARSRAESKAAAMEAIERCKPLTPASTAQELARAIAPDGPAKLIASRTQGSFLNGWIASRAESSPETSGYATRQAWFKATPNDPQRRILWAEALMKNGRQVEAGMIAEDILVKDKNNVRAGLIMAEAHRLQGEFAKSGLEYTELIKRNPKLMPALLGMGQVALEKSLFPIALKVYTDATALEPENATAWVGLGRAHYNQRLNFGAAVDAFARAKKLAPERTDFAISYANALRAIFRWDEAEVLLRERLVDIPDDPEAHFQLATVLLDSKRNAQREAEAERLLRRSLELEPRAIAAMARLGSLLVQHSNGKEAIPYLEAVIADDMFHVAATKDLATAYRLAGRLKEAKDAQESFSQLTIYMEKRNFLDDLLRREPMKPELHDKLAALLESGGENNKAKLHRDAAIMLRKDPKKAKLGLEALNNALASTEIVNESTKKR